MRPGRRDAGHGRPGKSDRMRARGRVRIIGGRWRRRLLPVPEAPGLRPTPDRVRETLFNWLAGELPGARCLDLFAGTGALGFEAASRGASQVVLVEREPRVAAHLEQQARDLGAAATVRVVCADALRWCREAGDAYDILFVDPPYDGVELPALLALLDSAGRIAPGGCVFVESSAGAGAAPLPPHWQVLREQRAGRVRYHLAAPGPSGASDAPAA